MKVVSCREGKVPQGIRGVQGGGQAHVFWGEATRMAMENEDSVPTWMKGSCAMASKSGWAWSMFGVPRSIDVVTNSQTLISPRKAWGLFISLKHGFAVEGSESPKSFHLRLGEVGLDTPVDARSKCRWDQEWSD